MSRFTTTLSFALLCSTFAACVDADATTDTEYLFGMTAADVLAVKPLSQRAMTDAEWLDAHRGSFDCGRYGGLCKMIGRDAAYDAIETGYRIALAGGDLAAVRDAQRQLIDEAKLVERDAPTLFDTLDDCELGNSGGSFRVCASATATDLWPSRDLRADGSCRTQVNSGGWWARNTESLDGILRAEYRAGNNTVVVVVNPAAQTNVSQVGFTQVQRTADSVTVTVTCDADDDAWDATADVSNFTT